MIRDVFHGFVLECRQYSIVTAAQRAAWSLRVPHLGDLWRRLGSSRSMKRHVSMIAPWDRLFCVSHKHFLVRGLTARQRVDAAVAHYEAEDRDFGSCYFAEVYERGGLKLWHRDVAGVSYDIRLTPGLDLLQEGGLSIALHVDGERVAVLSFSRVPVSILLPGQASGGLVPFVTRKQLSSERGYQAAFFQAFDHVTPARLLVGALAGYALANGHRVVVGIAPERHPAWAENLRDQFSNAYSEFWTTFAGRRASPFGYLIDLPLIEKPLDGCSSSRRKRSRLRRAHIEMVCRSAQAVMTSHLHPSRAWAGLPLVEPAVAQGQPYALNVG